MLPTKNNKQRNTSRRSPQNNPLRQGKTQKHERNLSSLFAIRQRKQIFVLIFLLSLLPYRHIRLESSGMNNAAFDELSFSPSDPGRSPHCWELYYSHAHHLRMNFHVCTLMDACGEVMGNVILGLLRHKVVLFCLWTTLIGFKLSFPLMRHG